MRLREEKAKDNFSPLQFHKNAYNSQVLLITQDITMKNIKSVLLVMHANLSQDLLLKYANLPYSKVCILYSGKKELKHKKISPKLDIISFCDGNDLLRKMRLIFEKYTEYLLMPHFI